VTFTVPESFGSAGVAWEVLVDTAVSAPVTVDGADGAGADGGRGRLGSRVGWAGSVLNLDVAARAIVVLRGIKRNGG
jgi:hypothetical protein